MECCEKKLIGLKPTLGSAKKNRSRSKTETDRLCNSLVESASSFDFKYKYEKLPELYVTVPIILATLDDLLQLAEILEWYEAVGQEPLQVELLLKPEYNIIIVYYYIIIILWKMQVD